MNYSGTMPRGLSADLKTADPAIYEPIGRRVFVEFLRVVFEALIFLSFN
jgi:hypothetical protein